jgi:hypothetical protein
VNLALIAATAYLLGAVITYGVLIDRPEVFGLNEIADDIRAAQPRLTERQIEYAIQRGHQRVSVIAAALWPLLLIVLAGAALLDLPNHGRNRP